MNYLKLRNGLDKLNLNIFTTQTAADILGTSPAVTRNALERYKKLSAVISPKRGLYYLNDKPPDSYEIAYHLYQPSYISFETALSDYGIIPEVVYTVTCATTKPTRTFESMGIAYDYHKIKNQAYTGYKKRDRYLIAEPEKALADYLYFVATEGKTLNDRLDLHSVDKELAKKYCVLFNNPHLTKLAKRLL